jgi:molecular chaperone GrpE
MQNDLKIEEEELDQKVSEEVQEEGNEVENLKNLVARLKEENSELKNKYLAKLADFDNYKKRMEKQMQDARKYAISDIMQDLINVVDNFERAIKSGQENQDYNSFYEGISMIEKEFTTVLDKYNLVKFGDLNTEFNPERHEAIAQEVDAKYKDATVIEVYQKGYLIHDRVLRTAKVKVGVN